MFGGTPLTLLGEDGSGFLDECVGVFAALCYQGVHRFPLAHHEKGVLWSWHQGPATAMPVDFLTEDQRRTYGAFPTEISLTDLAQFCYLDDTDWQSLARRWDDPNRLRDSLQRCTLRYLGAFLPVAAETPVAVVAYLARQLAIPIPGPALQRYHELEARWDHPTEIRTAYGYIAFSDALMSLPFVRMLYVRYWTRQATSSGTG